MKMLVISGLSFLLAASSFADPCCKASRGGGSSVGVPNPASVYCVKVARGKEINLTSQLGEEGYCVFKGGATIDSWTLFRIGGKQPQIALDVYLTAKRGLKSRPRNPRGLVGMPNPASAFCAQVGGQSVIVEDSEGAQSGVCEFSDHSQIEEWTLFRETSDESNVALTKFLTKVSR